MFNNRKDIISLELLNTLFNSFEEYNNSENDKELIKKQIRITLLYYSSNRRKPIKDSGRVEGK